MGKAFRGRGRGGEDYTEMAACGEEQPGAFACMFRATCILRPGCRVLSFLRQQQPSALLSCSAASLRKPPLAFGNESCQRNRGQASEEKAGGRTLCVLRCRLLWENDTNMFRQERISERITFSPPLHPAHPNPVPQV